MAHARSLRQYIKHSHSMREGSVWKKGAVDKKLLAMTINEEAVENSALNPE